jgi:DNA-directed RNA polymerase subunit K/omega
LKIGEKLIWPKNRLTRFEVARLLGARALQISLGAPILVKTEETEAEKIAELEFKEKMLPITIKRKMPSGEQVVVEIKGAIDNWLTERKGEI